MILSLLYTHTPETCRLIMIDPKMLELSVYDGIPHLLTPVVQTRQSRHRIEMDRAGDGKSVSKYVQTWGAEYRWL